MPKFLAVLLFTITLFVQGCAPVPDVGENKIAKAKSERPLNLHVASPDWRDQVIYFLMIDRFNDGNSDNNDQGYNEYDPSRESHYNGGDIVGIIQQLDYIKNLGATSVWLTPPVANQWWSKASSYSGYHGYWARDFKKVDEHYGSLEDYQQLSHDLHERDMYLIQDIVVNHSGIFFGYDGDFYPGDTSKNFILLEEGHQAAPDMAPFHMVDRNNPAHVAADIYNWTPPATDYLSDQQQFTYQLGNLSDINTKNPQVLTAFKDAYKYWMREVGVDAFRIDTVKYVEHEFWHHFLHDNDGIYAQAKSLGKSHFLTFGEVFDASSPFSDKGEKKVTGFLGTKDKPELNSVIGFPLYFEIGSVLGEGKPTRQLEYRLEKFMELYPDPYVTPNFIDNHDTKRFLAGASHDALKQALTLLFTIPGIPVIYQGTEQAHEETRQAMFAGGFMTQQSQFDESSEFYQFIKSLANIRTANNIFSRGDLEILQSDEAGPGVFAYKRQYKNQTAIIVLNTADHSTLLSDVSTGLAPGQKLHSLLRNTREQVIYLGTDGQLSVELPPRAIAIYMAKQEFADLASRELPANDLGINDPEKNDLEINKPDDVVIKFDVNLEGRIFTGDVTLSGNITKANTGLKLILNGNLDKAQSFNADHEGNWRTIIPVRNLGVTPYSAQVYVPEFNTVSDKVRFIASVREPDITKLVIDAENDAIGLSGTYIQPEQESSQQQMDILAIEAKSAGANLVLTLKMNQISDVWAPANQFDNTSFTIFFDMKNKQGAKALPLINSVMADGRDWDLAHVAYGWGNYMYRAINSSAHSMGDKVGIAPKITVDKAAGEITFSYFGEQFGITDWQDVFIYITTWDISGEGAYRELTPEGGEWQFGGASSDSPKILDTVTLQLH